MKLCAWFLMVLGMVLGACAETNSDASLYDASQQDIASDVSDAHEVAVEGEDHPLNPGTMPCASDKDCAPKGGGPSGTWKCSPDGEYQILHARTGVCLSIGWCETEQFAAPCPWGCKLQAWGAEECNSPSWRVEPAVGRVALECMPCEPAAGVTSYPGDRWCKDKSGHCVKFYAGPCEPHHRCNDDIDCTFDRCAFDGKCEHLPVDSWCGTSDSPYACVNRSEDAPDGGCVEVCNPATNDIVTGKNETCSIVGGGSGPCVPSIPNAVFTTLFTEHCTMRGFCEPPRTDAVLCDEGMTCVDGKGCQISN